MMPTENNSARQPSEAAALSIEGVSKSFFSESGRRVPALENVTLSLHKGEFLTLIGPTGCGKTTLLGLVAGLEHPDAGTVRLADGLAVGRNVAYVFQHYTLFPWRDVAGNIVFGLQMARVAAAERRRIAAELLARLGLSGFRKSYPHELSGGMRQRVAIAQALAMQPSLLLMDEPFGALDDWTRRDLQQMLIDLQQQMRVTILFVTHNIDEAILLGDRIVVLSGRPGTVAGDFPVTMPRPHDPKTQAFTNLFLEVRRCLYAGRDGGGAALQ